MNTAALARRAAHDIAAPHEERAAGRHIDTAAAGISCFSCAGASGDGAAIYHLCAGSVLLPQTGGFRHAELIDRIGLAVHQREGGTVFHPDNAAAANQLQHIAVQVKGDLARDDNGGGYDKIRSALSRLGLQIIRAVGEGQLPADAILCQRGARRLGYFFLGKPDGALLLGVIIRQGAAVLQKLTAEIQVLLIWQSTVLILNFLLDIIDAVAAFHLQGQRFLPAQGAAIHINWHGMGGGEQHGQGQQYG